MIVNIVKNEQLPKGWVTTTIGDLLEFEYGKGLTKKKRNETGKFPVYGSNGIVGYHDNFLIEAPALIIGRKGAAGEVSYSDKNCWPIDTTYFINNLSLLNIIFVYYLLKSLRLNQYDTSTAIPGLNRNDAYRLSLSLPSLSEQQRIVERIEELFSELDNGIANLKKARQQLKTYHQAVLKYAFEGKLTKEWRTQQVQSGNPPPEPAGKLLDRIRKERERHYKKQVEDWEKAYGQAKTEGKKKPSKPQKPKELPPLTEKELSELPELPEGWGWCKLEDLSYIITKGASPKWQGFKYVNDPTKVLFITSENIRSNYIDIDNPKYLEDAFSSKQKNSVLQNGDILLNIVGASIGRAAIYAFKLNANINQAVSLIRLTDQNLKEFISIFLNTSFANKFYSSKKVDVARANLSLVDVSNIPIPLCSKMEINFIVSEIETRLSVCDKLEQTIEDSLKKAEALRQSILKKAFSGKLTREWREEHPELISGENSAENARLANKGEKQRLRKAKKK